MWILPRPLHTSPFVQDTGGLISDLQEQSQISAQSLLVRSKPLPVRTWLAKWKRDSWTQHLSGRILKPSLGMSFLERWTSCLEASLASHSVVQESEMETKIPDTSSPTFWTALEDADLPLFSLKMLKESSPQNCQETTGEIQQERRFCSMSLGNWSEWVTKQRQEYSARVKSAHLTRGSGSSSWPTISVNEAKNSQGKSQLNRNTPPSELRYYWPTIQATEARQGFQDRSRGMKGQQESLTTIVVKQNWPTPEAFIQRGPIKTELTQTGFVSYHGNQKYGAKLSDAVTCGLADQGNLNTSGSRQELWATPRTHQGDNPSEHQRRSPNIAVMVKTEDNTNQSGKLNPRWVETLMGLPVGWVMPSCQNPITPQGDASPSAGGGSWMTPEAQNSTGYHMSNGKKILKLGSQVMENFASPVTIEPTNSDSSETE